MPNVGFASLQVIPSFKGAEAALAGGISAPAAAAGKSAGGIMGGTLGTALKAAAGPAIVVGVGAGLLKLGSSFQDSFKTIRVATGETGAGLEGLEGSFKKVLAVRPDSFDSVSTAIAKLNVGLGLTGAPLEELSTQVLRLSSLTKTDLGTNLESVTTLFNSFGVKAGEQGPKLDELFRASQATGVSVSELASSMASGGSVLRTAGFDFEESAALLGLLGKSGVSTSSVMAPLSKAIATAAKAGKSAGDVFKETFDSIRSAPDATSAAGAAISVFGARAGPKLAGLIREGKLSYEELAATISSGSDTIASAAKDTSTLSGKFKVLKNAVAVALQPIATRLFNTLNELAAKALPHIISGISAFGRGISHLLDVAAPFAKTITEGIGKVVDAFKVLLGGDDGPQGFGEIMDNLLGNSGKYVGLFRSIGEAILQVVGFVREHLKPILIGLGVAFVALTSPITAVVAGLIFAYTHFKIVRDVVAAVVAFLVETVAPAVATFATFIADQFAALVEWVRLHWDAISEAISHVIAFVSDVISAAVTAITAVWHVWGDDLLRIVHAVWDVIGVVVKTAIDLVRGVIETTLALINGDWGEAWEGLKGIISTVWDGIKGIVSGALDAIFGFIGGAGDTIATLASGMWDGIKNAFRSALNWIIDKWNSLEFTISGKLPFPPHTEFSGTIGTPKIDRFHRGGLFRAPAGQSEGLAILSDGERVLTPSQSDSFAGGMTIVVQSVLDGKIIAQSTFEQFRDRASNDGPFLSRAGAA